VLENELNVSPSQTLAEHASNGIKRQTFSRWIYGIFRDEVRIIIIGYLEINENKMLLTEHHQLVSLVTRIPDGGDQRDVSDIGGFSLSATKTTLVFRLEPGNRTMEFRKESFNFFERGTWQVQ